MKKYVCAVCGFVYDEAAGYPEAGIEPGTKWEDLPGNWECPLCGAAKSEFDAEEAPAAQVVSAETLADAEDNLRELSFGELSAVCSNLAKGCLKQYRAEEAGLFEELAAYYEHKTEQTEETAQLDALLEMIDQDLVAGYSAAKGVARLNRDRGAMRAVVWGEKVTRILQSLIKRYEKKQDALLENTNVYVCEICGFVYAGDEPPRVCPVCKVPNIKLALIERS